MTEQDAFARSVKSAAEKVANLNDSDVLFFASGIDDSAVRAVVKALSEREDKRENLLLMITTLGGDPHCAFRIMKRLWNAYPNGKIVAFVHSVCASAGTLMVIGTCELVMSDTAELGPLDVQLAKQDDLVASMSGLTPTKALETLRKEAVSCFHQVFMEVQRRSRFRVTLRTASDIAVRLTTGLYEHLFSQIDPFRVAEVQRNNQIAQEYGLRLDKYKILQEDALFKLINGYPAHEIIIDRTEASDSLFRNVRQPTPEEFDLASILLPIFEDSLKTSNVYVDFVNQKPEKVNQKPENQPENDNETDSSSTHSQ